MSLVILIVALFTGESLSPRRASAASTQGAVWPDAPLNAQSSFYYADYKVPPAIPKSAFLPDVPHCPQTGRTVCSDIDKYPS